uniref:NADH-ubiquinone oxidoreductase chain 2 n=1 Tax=Haliplus lineatocollis TaxID=107853 RepID=A0A191ZRC5_9COLE|nr:NADH dehydrogenase subunit 2 [Haliplus lineatocollis]
MYKILFTITLIMGTLISISSYTWMGTWMGLEINLLSFIPMMMKKNNSFSSESSIKYFLIQAMASSIFMFMIILIMINNNMINNWMYINQFMMMLVNSTLMLKMGAAPFHFWFPEIIEGMSWMNSLMLMTWQKIAPMMLLSYTLKYTNYIIMIILISTLIGSIIGLNQTSLRKLLTYSSINHIGWMLSSFLINDMMWILYFSIYSFISITIIYILNKMNLFYMKQIYMMLNYNIIIKFMIMLNLLSLGGLPPFLGFLPKWIIIQYMSMNYIYLILFMIMMTLITLFFYLQISYSSLMIMHNNINFNLINKNYKISMNMMILSFISICSLMMFTLFFNFY